MNWLESSNYPEKTLEASMEEDRQVELHPVKQLAQKELAPIHDVRAQAHETQEP